MELLTSGEISIPTCRLEEEGFILNMNGDTLACRVCMRSSMEVVLLESEIQDGCPYTLKDFFVFSTHLEVNNDDGLPNYLCSFCADELRKFFEFVQKANESDQVMREKINTLGVTTAEPDVDVDDRVMSFTMDDKVVVDDEEPKFEPHIIRRNETTLESNDEHEMNVIHTAESVSHHGDDNMDDPGEIRLEDFSFKELAEPTGQGFVQRKYICTQCRQQFSFKVDLAKHLTESHSDNEFLCKLCGVQCTSRDMLTSHLFKHRDLKTYSCKHCDIPHFTKFGLRIHMSQTHLNENSLFSCTVCKKVFIGKQRLENHHLIHATEIKNYPCHLCEKRFSTATHLKHHILVHKGIQPYVRYNYRFGKEHKCTICLRVLRRPSDLRKHMLEHEGRKAYECPDCPKGFKRRYRFRAHLEEAHNKTLDNDKVVEMNSSKNG